MKTLISFAKIELECSNKQCLHEKDGICTKPNNVSIDSYGFCSNIIKCEKDSAGITHIEE